MNNLQINRSLLQIFKETNWLTLSATGVSFAYAIITVYKCLFSFMFNQGSFLLLGSFLFNCLMIFLLVFNKPIKEFNGSFQHWVFVVGVQFIPFFFQYNPQPNLFFIATPLFLAGMIISLTSLINLGRRFGVIAANRGIQDKGLYSLVRHPLYFGELVWFSSITLAHFCSLNVVLLLLLILICQVKRIFDEEALLNKDVSYQDYSRRVNHRLIPFFF